LYQDHRARAAAASVEPLPFLSWVGFPVERALVVVDNQGRYEITDYGRTFLQFANNAGLTEARQF
jgi:hypothetical protein